MLRPHLAGLVVERIEQAGSVSCSGANHCAGTNLSSQAVFRSPPVAAEYTAVHSIWVSTARCASVDSPVAGHGGDRVEGDPLRDL